MENKKKDLEEEEYNHLTEITKNALEIISKLKSTHKEKEKEKGVKLEKKSSPEPQKKFSLTNKRLKLEELHEQKAFKYQLILNNLGELEKNNFFQKSVHIQMPSTSPLPRFGESESTSKKLFAHNICNLMSHPKFGVKRRKKLLDDKNTYYFKAQNASNWLYKNLELEEISQAVYILNTMRENNLILQKEKNVKTNVVHNDIAIWKFSTKFVLDWKRKLERKTSSSNLELDKFNLSSSPISPTSPSSSPISSPPSPPPSPSTSPA